MSEELIISQCSPTMAGLKTGNLFLCDYSSQAELNGSVRRINTRLVPKGLRLLPLRCKNNRALMYMYRPKKLRSDLYNDAAVQILLERQYPVGEPEKCIVELKRRVSGANDFPHEIGLFLGYPPEDVSGFIENNAKCAKCSGVWKVYGDEGYAKRKFAQYKKCTASFCSAYKRHHSFDRLIVAN